MGWDDESGEEWDDEPEETQKPASSAKKKVCDEEDSSSEEEAEPAAKSSPTGPTAKNGPADGGFAPPPRVEERINHTDSMAELDIKFMKDVDKLIKMIVPKLQEATPPKAASKFYTDATNRLAQTKLTLAEVETMQKRVKEVHARKKEEEKKKAEEKRKQEALEDAEKKKAELGEQQVADDDFFADFM